MTAARLLDVPAAAIRLTPANPRTDGAEDLDGLTASLAHGLAQRPTLIEVEPGVFEVLTGERRVRAGLALGWTAIPAVVEDVLDPLAAHSRRVAENLHRRDLNPLDEARALKLDWLIANVLALDLADEAGAALAEAGSVRAGLAAVAAVLEAAEWSSSRPTVTQEAYLQSRGLGISKAMLRKKLQVLGLSAAAEARLDGAGLTEAGLRAFLRLGEADQALLLDAIERDPELAKETRTIVGWVCDKNKGRTMRDAIAIARGEVPGASADELAAVPGQLVSIGDRSGDSGWESGPDEAPASGGPVDEQAAAELVLPLMETAQALESHLAALARTDLGQLPEPWAGFAREALTTIQTSIQPYV